MLFTVSAFLTGLAFILCEFDKNWYWLKIVGVIVTIASIFTL